MLERLLIEHCAPTLAGLKTANLWREPLRETLKAEVDAWDDVLRTKGVRVRIVWKNKGCALIYVYRPQRLWCDLRREKAKTLLKEYGYPEETDACIAHLESRMEKAEGFPHEIGLFLGYPPEDVDGFIQNGGKHCKCSGCWKVYYDLQSAQRQFARLRKCKEVYGRLYRSGTTLMKLTVAA